MSTVFDELVHHLARVKELAGELDLDTLEERADRLTRTMSALRPEVDGLAELVERSDRVVRNLGMIRDSELDLASLDTMAGRLARNLREVADLLERDQVEEVLRKAQKLR
jgi:hypothetical protein